MSWSPRNVRWQSGVIPYSPLAGGLLTGKYRRADLTAANVSDDGAP